MKRSESIKEISVAMAQFLGEVENTSKDKEGYGYKYADLGQLLSLCRPLLSRNKLAIFQSVENPEGNEDRCCVHTLLSHESGEWIETQLSMPVFAGKGMNSAQCMGSVATYARRYALSAMLGITQEDDDGRSGGSKPQEAIRQAPRLIAASQVKELGRLIDLAGLTSEVVTNGLNLKALSEITVDQYSSVIRRLNAALKKRENEE